MEQFLNIEVLTGANPISLPHLKKKVVLEVFGLAWNLVRVALILLTFSGVVMIAKTYHSHLPTPVKMKMTDKLTVSQELVQITKALRFLNCPQTRIATIAEGILKGAKTIGVSPNLILALLFTESEFNPKAVSSAGYKGYMQTPRASMEYADVDILYGVRILESKMKSPQAKKNGKVDIRTALAMYKGGLSPLAFKQADEVLRLYKKLDKLCTTTG